jgi:hypothetical protein
MPISYIIDPLRRRVDVVLDGEVTIEDAIGVFDTIVRAPDFQPGFAILSDHRRLGRPFSTEEVHRLTDWMEEHASVLRPTRWAAVVSRPTSFGLMRMLAARAKLTAGIDVGVFLDLHSADAWLSAPYPAPGSSP